MIDLHMHTKYSDGDYAVRELIDILNKNKIGIASITDHNNIGAVIEYLENGYQEYFKGVMIPGTEIQTIIDDYLIEVLVYNFNVYDFKKFVDGTRENFWKFHHEAYQELLKKAQVMGLKFREPDRELQNGYYCNMKFQEAIANCLDYNKNIIDERVLTDHLYFYRHEFQNPDSRFYVDNKKAFPKIDEVIDVAHECGGVVSLAHVDEYQSIEDKMQFLSDLINREDIDGIECFHPCINDENNKKYRKFCQDNDILISAGSDFHGPHLSHRQGINTKATMEDVTILKKILK